jgi:hypothetical protein
MSLPRTAATVCILALGAAGAAAAQAPMRIHAIEWTFAGGYYQPTATSGQSGSLALTRKPSWIGSSHLNFYAPGGRLGFEVSAGYAPERVRQTTTAGAPAGSRRTNMLYGTAKVVMGRSPRLPGVSYMVGGGVGVMHRQKSVLDSNESATNLGGAASFMVRIPIDGQVGLRLDVQDIIYSADYGLGSKMRNDLFFTAGLGVSW